MGYLFRVLWKAFIGALEKPLRFVKTVLERREASRKKVYKSDYGLSLWNSEKDLAVNGGVTRK